MALVATTTATKWCIWAKSRYFARFLFSSVLPMLQRLCLPGGLRKECAYLWLQVLCSTHYYSIALQVTYVFPAVAYITILTEYSETFVHCLYHAFCQFNLHWWITWDCTTNLRFTFIICVCLLPWTIHPKMVLRTRGEGADSTISILTLEQVCWFSVS